jgi:hypothetical protein
VPWKELLQECSQGHHITQLYQDEAFLIEAATLFIRSGLQREEGVVVVATSAHREAFIRQLEAQGLQPQEAVRRGQFVLLDARLTLEGFMRDGMPEWTPFYEAAGGMIDSVRARYPKLRLYGEIVNLLWHEGQRDAALQLEDFWNDMVRMKEVAIFCSYMLDSLSGEAYDGLEAVCRAHTHLIPVRDYARFESAVSESSNEVFGRQLARMLESLASAQRPGTQMPPAQAMLLWLKRNMPFRADEVLAQARAALARSAPDR